MSEELAAGWVQSALVRPPGCDKDYFAKWPETIPLKDATAKSVAGALLSVILMWGPPAELLRDQGPEFVAELNHELLR